MDLFAAEWLPCEGSYSEHSSTGLVDSRNEDNPGCEPGVVFLWREEREEREEREVWESCRLSRCGVGLWDGLPLLQLHPP